jgi:lysophospholipid acyltransferase (LPLAT)-like uncharacterized protein
MRPLRNPVIQGVLAWTLAQWMRFCFATIRWTWVNQAVAEKVWADGGGVLAVFWHSRIGLSPACWPLDRATPAKALISLSADGEFIAKAVARQGFPAVRGSSSNKDKADRAKGGSQALRDGLRQLRDGGLAITPDGPRGPMREMAEGLPLLAKLSRAPVLFIGMSCNPAIRLNVDTTLLRLPLIGRLTRDLHGARMARTLSTMIAAGLPVLEGLTITARTVSNRRLRQATETMADAVREGGGLSAAMRRADVFPPILVTMTASGEAGGRLEPMLERAADYLEREFSTFTAVMLSLIEPAIIVVMGGVVAVIILSILLPILQINTLAMG